MYVVLDDVDAALGGGLRRVHDEHALDAEIALLVGEPGLLTDCGHGADGVEEIRQHQREDDSSAGQHADLGEAAEEAEVHQR